MTIQNWGKNLRERGGKRNAWKSINCIIAHKWKSIDTIQK